MSFIEHRDFERVVEFRVEAEVRGGEVDVAEVQPLPDEVLRELPRLRAFQHPFDLRAKHGRLRELVFFREGEELVIRHRAPQEVAQPRREREVVELTGAFAQEEELRRHQHTLECNAHRGFKAVLLRHPASCTMARYGVMSSSVTARRNARLSPKSLEQLGGVNDSGTLEGHLDAIAVVRGRRLHLRQVAEDAAVTFAGGQVFENRSFHLDILHREAGPHDVLLRAPILLRTCAVASP